MSEQDRPARRSDPDDGRVPAPGGRSPHGFGSECPVRWMVDDIGRYLAGDDAPAITVGSVGREALSRAGVEVNELLRCAYSAHDVVATELRFAGPRRGFRRTVLAVSPSPVALMLLCTRLCDAGDDVMVLQHTAARGTARSGGRWPFGLDTAERLTRPPARDDLGPLPGLDESAA